MSPINFIESVIKVLIYEILNLLSLLITRHAMSFKAFAIIIALIVLVFVVVTLLTYAIGSLFEFFNVSKSNIFLRANETTGEWILLILFIATTLLRNFYLRTRNWLLESGLPVRASIATAAIITLLVIVII